MDEESKTDHKFAAELQKQQHILGFGVNFMYEPLPKDMTILKPVRGRFTVGYNRQLWSSFFMDLYTDADIIGWTDTDAVFSTPVTFENIFNGKKLRVIGVATTTAYQRTWDQATRVALGKKMLASFMVYFPTFIWRDTFTNCRKYILKHLNVSSFEDAFKQFHKPHSLVSGTVSLVMTYAYYFEHDRYDWHLDVNNNLTRFNIEHVEAGFKVPPAENSPNLHVTVHQKYYGRGTFRRNALKQGYCMAKRAVDNQLPNGCSEFHNITNFQLFEFEVTNTWGTHHLDTWCRATEGKKRCTELIEKHYQNVARYYRNGWYDLDLHKVFDIEKAAATVGHPCPRIFNFP